ncbi:hypothetical protein J6590_036804 [Homalodisca vitripennis]|nr:hypothetical protein J6590_036804 [Homalodisca vitripennis]
MGVENGTIAEAGNCALEKLTSIGIMETRNCRLVNETSGSSITAVVNGTIAEVGDCALGKLTSIGIMET